MSEHYYLADTHLGHKNIHKWRLRADGSAFESAEIHDEFIMDMWQTFIGKRDTVSLLGDAAFNVEGAKKFKNLAGNKTLIMGNHDPAITTMQQYFGCVRAMEMKSVDGFHAIFTHIPIHFDQLERWHLNVHGHLHARTIQNDPRYFNVSVEAIQFVPITLEEILMDVTKQVWGTRPKPEAIR